MSDIQGFWSYTHADDDSDNKRITQLAGDIASEYEMLTGEKLTLFLDIDKLNWGDDWRQKIDKALETIAFFIPVLTPRYFQSVECRRELQEFAGRATSAGLTELILPLYYVDFEQINNQNTDDSLVKLTRTFQRKDWRELRFSDTASELYRRGVHDLAQQIVRSNRELEQRNIQEIAGLEVVSSSSSSSSSSTDEEPGTLDLIAEAEQVITNLEPKILGLNSEMQVITDLTQESTKQLQDSDLVESSITYRLSLINKYAKKLNTPVDNIWTLCNDFASDIHAADPGIHLLIRQVSEEAKESEEAAVMKKEFFDAVRELHGQSSEAFTAVRDMIQETSSVEGLARQMRPPLRRLREGLTIMLESGEVIDSWVSLVDKLG